LPHLDVHALDRDLAGREEPLIAALTDAVAAVYGEWARPGVVVRLFGLPPGRWGVGGHPAEAPAPAVTFGIRADVFDRPDAETVLTALAAGVSAAIGTVLGARFRDTVTVEFVGRPESRVFVGA
jgi:phenylpyruvate tautomerase PptA (4-oxalocrotonate tautomerase family)